MASKRGALLREKLRVIQREIERSLSGIKTRGSGEEHRDKEEKLS